MSVEEKALANAIWNPIFNPINNPINNPLNNPLYAPLYAQARKSKRREEAVRYFNSHPQCAFSVLSSDEVSSEADKIIKYIEDELIGEQDEYGNVLPFPTFYIGETKRSLKEECFRWLTARGANILGGQYKGGRNRPVLVTMDGETIKGPLLKSMEFQASFLFHARFLVDATRVEEKIQTHFHDLKVGTERCWRTPAMGRSTDEMDVYNETDYKVFITWSRKVQQFISEGKIQSQPGRPPARPL